MRYAYVVVVMFTAPKKSTAILYLKVKSGVFGFAGTRDSETQIRDIPRNPGLVET